MTKRVLLLALAAFFVIGTVTAMAEGGASHDKNILQSMYDCCGGWGKSCGKSAECCKTCGKQCCAACKSECGGKCCADCGKK